MRRCGGCGRERAGGDGLHRRRQGFVWIVREGCAEAATRLSISMSTRTTLRSLAWGELGGVVRLGQLYFALARGGVCHSGWTESRGSCTCVGCSTCSQRFDWQSSTSRWPRSSSGCKGNEGNQRIAWRGRPTATAGDPEGSAQDGGSPRRPGPYAEADECCLVLFGRATASITLPGNESGTVVIIGTCLQLAVLQPSLSQSFRRRRFVAIRSRRQRSARYVEMRRVLIRSSASALPVRYAWRRGATNSRSGSARC